MRVFQRIKTDYEYILVDCPPALNVMTDNAVLACRRVLIPARMHRTYRGVINNLMGQINTLREVFEANIDIVGVVPVGFEQQTDGRRSWKLCERALHNFWHPHSASGRRSLRIHRMPDIHH